VRIGHRILAGSDSPAVQMAARIALSHHERWDGQGYPEGLSGEAIPIEARIVAIADVYDALSHARVYKAAWPEDEVLALLRRERGRSFDPALLDLFLEILPRIREIRDTLSG
jgi:putative two-component system response regulator